MKNRLLFILLFIFFPAASVQAHPHIFLQNKLEVVFDENGLAGFKAFWEADDFSTTGLTDGYDENENGRLDPFEIKLFEKDSVTNLKQFNYFTHIRINDKAFEVKFVQNFKAQLNNHRITYTFFIPCHVKATREKKEITLSQYDNSYYSFISFSENQPVTLVNGKKFKTDFTIEENKKESYYFDMIHPIALILRFNK